VPDIFSEVDEEVRRDRMLKLWKRFGPILIGAVVLFIAGMAGKIYWDQWREGLRIAESDRYQRAVALMTQGDADAGAPILEDLGKNSKFGYKLLARLQLAAELARAGKRDEALAAYDAIAGEGGAERRYRDYAALMAASLTIDQGDFDGAAARLQPLMAEGAPWAFSAKELYGTALYLKGDIGGAEGVFSELLADPKTPADMQGRAKEMLLVLEAAAGAAKPLAGDSEAVADHADGE
jgi:hypothetical protein